MGYVRNQNKKKSLLRHSLRVFFVWCLHIHTLHLTTFLKVKNVEFLFKFCT